MTAPLLKLARELTGVSLKSLGKEVNVHYTDLSRFENSIVNLNEKQRTRLCKALKSRCKTRIEELRDMEGRLG
jgi:ribosome-binding protein aMBF1 (putative translation factor)